VTVRVCPRTAARPGENCSESLNRPNRSTAHSEILVTKTYGQKGRVSKRPQQAPRSDNTAQNTLVALTGTQASARFMVESEKGKKMISASPQPAFRSRLHCLEHIVCSHRLVGLRDAASYRIEQEQAIR
jgi:hypothetical protein